jgi:hypothetical protein
MKSSRENESSRGPWRTLLRGAWQGAAATLPMTLTMAAANQATGAPVRVRSLPPTRLGKKVSVALGLPARMRKPARIGLGLVAHLCIGATLGAGFALLARRFPSLSRRKLRSGIAFGTVVWAATYGGVLPGVGLLEPPHRSPRGQAAAVLAAHWVYGAALAAMHRP